MYKSNPTTKTQRIILKAIQETDELQSLTAIAQKTNKSIYSVKAVVEFFEKTGLLKTYRSSGGTTFVLKNEVSNATTN